MILNFDNEFKDQWSSIRKIKGRSVFGKLGHLSHKKTLWQVKIKKPNCLGGNICQHFLELQSKIVLNSI